jgi:hypothetical protein
MEKEPRRSRRGLDSQTLTALQSTSLEYLTPATGAHAAEEAVHLLVLAVMRLKRALHTYTSYGVTPKDTGKIISDTVPYVKGKQSPGPDRRIQSPSH